MIRSSGVTNWLLSLTGYGNKRLSSQWREPPGHKVGSQKAYRCRSLALFWQPLYHSLIFFFALVKHQCTNMYQNTASASIHPVFRALDSKIPRGQGRRCRQRGVIILCGKIRRLKLLFLNSKYLSLYIHVSFRYCLQNCSPITYQQSAKTSDVK